MIQYLMKTTENGRYRIYALQNITTYIKRGVGDNDMLFSTVCCMNFCVPLSFHFYVGIYLHYSRYIIDAPTIARVL